MKRQKGQALLEMIYLFPIMAALILMVVWSMGTAWSLFWVQYQLQDAVICLSDSSSYLCKGTYLQKIKNGAAYLRIQHFTLEKRSDQLYGKIHFSHPFSGRQNFAIEKSIPWPIRQ